MYLAILSLAVLLNADTKVVTSDDLENAFQELKAAESQKNVESVKLLATKVFTIARDLASQPAPEGDVEKESWTKRLTWVKEVGMNTEYVLSVASYNTTPAETVELIGMIETHNPKSSYLDGLYVRYMVALDQAGAKAKIPAVAEKAIKNFPDNEDLLTVLADLSLERKQPTQALNYAKRLTAVMSRHPKPEGMSAADWERKRTNALGRGYYIAGIILGEKNQYFEADKTLRLALPLIKGNDGMTAAVLYYLGVSNFNLGRMTLNKAQVLEAAKFSDQAAAISGPFAANAAHNARAIRFEASKMR